MYRAGKDAEKWEFPAPVTRNGLATTFLESNQPMPTAYACAWSCPTLCNPVDCSPPGSSVHGISQARILEWVAITYSRGSSSPWTESVYLVSPALAGIFFTTVPPGKPQYWLKTKIYRILTHRQGCLLEHCLQKPKNGKQCKRCY